MSFLSPLFLLGLPLIGIPIGIHLLNRRQQKILNWGAMRFLVSATTRRRRLWRMSDLLLLLLRVLAVFFIVGALARPLLPVTWLGQSGPRAVILILDTSLSMSASDDGFSLFDELIVKTDNILEQLGPSDSLQVILARDNPTWLQELPVEANAKELRRIRSEIRQLRPTLGSSDLTAAIHLALDAPEDKEKMVRMINVITDGQAYGWSMDDETPWAEMDKKIEKAVRPTTINLDLVENHLSEHPNLAVAPLKTIRTVSAVTQPITVEALIQNRGSKPSSAAVLHWYLEDQSIGISSVPALQPGNATSLKLTHAFDESGHFDLWCQLDSSDAIDLDNEAHVVFTITDQLPVLIVDGSSATDPLHTDVGYLMASLGILQGQNDQGLAWDSGFAPTVIPISELSSQDLSPFRCVILANPRRLQRNEMPALRNYVRNGGGLWLAAGDAMMPNEFNETWYANGAGLSPLPLLTTIGDPDDREAFAQLQPPSESHPATQLLSDLQRLDIDKVQIFRRHQFDELSSLDTSILLRLDHGDALAIEQSIGEGRCIILAAPLGLTWSNFPVCQSFVAMVHEWIWYLATPSFPRHNLALGESIEIEMSRVQGATDLTIARPDNQTVSLSSVENRARYTQTQIPGLYAVTSESQALRSPFYINRDPEESTLTTLAADQLSTIANRTGFQVGAVALEAPKNLDLEIPTTPMAGTLLVVLLAIVVGELLLAAWCTQQRNPAVSAVKMEG